jgi:hypothetical protein
MPAPEFGGQAEEEGEGAEHLLRLREENRGEIAL